MEELLKMVLGIIQMVLGIMQQLILDIKLLKMVLGIMQHLVLMLLEMILFAEMKTIEIHRSSSVR